MLSRSVCVKLTAQCVIAVAVNWLFFRSTEDELVSGGAQPGRLVDMVIMYQISGNEGAGLSSPLFQCKSDLCVPGGGGVSPGGAAREHWTEKDSGHLPLRANLLQGSRTGTSMSIVL